MSEQVIFDVYAKIELGNNAICECCQRAHPNLSRPVSIWQVGTKYENSKYKLLFVGKNARGNPGRKKGAFLDSTICAEDLFCHKGWAYWSYTKTICETLYNGDAWEQFAFTNMVKCNSSATLDTTTGLQKQNCIANLGAFRKELEILKPRNVIFYTGREYDAYLNAVFDDVEIRSDMEQKVGRKKMPWLEFNGRLGANEIRALRVGHPERMKKGEFTGRLCKWVQSSGAIHT